MHLDDRSSRVVLAERLRVLYVDPGRPGIAVWSDLPGTDHLVPLSELGRAAIGNDDGLRNGTYRHTGKQHEGRWIYQLDESTAR